MKLALDSDEVRRVLCGYATNTLGIAANRMSANDDGSVTLWWQPPPDAPRKQSVLFAIAYYLFLGPVWHAIFRGKTA